MALHLYQHGRRVGYIEYNYVSSKEETTIRSLTCATHSLRLFRRTMLSNFHKPFSTAVISGLSMTEECTFTVNFAFLSNSRSAIAVVQAPSKPYFTCVIVILYKASFSNS